MTAHLKFASECEPHQPSVAAFKGQLKLLSRKTERSFESPAAWLEFETDARKAFEPYFTLSSMHGLFVKGLMSKDVAEAAACFAQACGLAVVLKSDSAHRGVMRGLLLESGVMATKVLDPALTDLIASRVRRWDELHVRAARELDEASKRCDELARVVAQSQQSFAADRELLKGDVSVARGETVRLSKDTQVKLGEIERESTAKVQSLTEETKSRLDTFEVGVKSKIALQAPVKYWQDKGTEHWRRALWFSIAFGVWLVVSTATIGYVLGPGSEFQFLPLEADWTKLPVARLVALGLMVTLAVWVARVLLRILLNHLHLLSDSRERETMVQTYLALLAEGSGLSEADRRCVIDALFRRAGSGFGKDDANPPTLLPWVSKSP